MPNLLPQDGYDTILTAPLNAGDTTAYIAELPTKTAGFLTIYAQDGRTVREKIYYANVASSPNRLTGLLRDISGVDTAGAYPISSGGDGVDHSEFARIAMTVSVDYVGRALAQLNGTEELGGVPQLPASRTIDDAREVTDKEYVDAVAGAAGGITSLLVSKNGSDPTLTINVASGTFVAGASIVSYAGAAAQAVTASQSNYVQIQTDGTLVINTTSFVNGNIPLALVVCDSSTITSITDRRPWITMALTPDQVDALAGTSGTPASDNKFVTEEDVTATPTANAIPRANGSGKLANGWVSTKFGGDGSDGALNVTSGTTTIDLGSAQYVVKNYTSINVSVGATLNFSNPHANGTIIALKSQGSVTIAGTIDASGMGAAGGAAQTSSGANGNDGTQGYGTILITNKGLGGGGTGGSGAGSAGSATTGLPYLLNIAGKMVRVSPGAGGGGGGCGANNTGGGNAGARGGGALIIECGGALNFTGTVNVSGSNATSASQASTGRGGNGGGGGGAGGTFVAIYNTLTSAAGTVTKNGGNGANGQQAGTGNNNAGGGGGGSGGAHQSNGGSGGAGASGGGGSGSSGSAGGGTGGGSAGSGGAGGGSTNSGGGGGGGGSAGVSYIVANTEFF